jgi:hypothetical protein
LQVTADDILAAIRRLHPEDRGEWVVLDEAWRIDALALQTWKGERPPHYRRVAYEIKTSRADFHRELARPQKRQFAIDISHEFYFATPVGLLREDEKARRVHGPGIVLPPECGLIEVDHSRGVLLGFDGPGLEPAIEAGVVERDQISAAVGAIPAERRQPRPWTEAEIAELLRYRFASYRVREARRKLEVAERAEAASYEHQLDLSERLERAHEQLAAERGDAVVEGSYWVGDWWDSLSGETQQAAVVRVVDVGEYVSIELPEHESEPERLLGIGEFLASHDPVVFDEGGTMVRDPVGSEWAE